jgi:hypothetical protein
MSLVEGSLTVTKTASTSKKENEVVIRLRPKKSVKWDESTAVDNEFAGRKKSKSNRTRSSTQLALYEELHGVLTLQSAAFFIRRKIGMKTAPTVGKTVTEKAARMSFLL